MFITGIDLNDRYQQQDHDALLLRQSKELSAWVWRNDCTAVGLAVLSQDDTLRDVTVTVSPFLDDMGHTLSGVSVARLGEVKAFVGNAGFHTDDPAHSLPKGPKENCFDPLYAEHTLKELPPRQIALFYLSLAAEADTVSGQYRGRVTVKSSAGEAFVRCTLTVLDALLPPPEEYAFRPTYWVYPFRLADYYGFEPFGSAHLAALKAHLLQYRAYGGVTLTGTLVDEAWGGQTYGGCPSLIEWRRGTDGQMRYDYTYLDRYIELAESIGLGEDIVLFSPLPWGNRIAYYDEQSGKIIRETVNMERYGEVWLPFLRALAEHLDQRNWFDRVSLGFDERPELGAVLDLIDRVKNKAGKVFHKQCALDRIGSGISNRIEAVSLSLNPVRQEEAAFRELVQRRRLAGRRTTVYTGTNVFPNSFLRSLPAESYWTMLYAGKLKTDGFLDWAYDAWVENPLCDATHFAFQAGDCFMVYPNDLPEDGSRLSLRSEKYGEGIRDVNKLCLMREKMPALANEIDALFAAVPPDYDHDVVENEAGWTVGNRVSNWITPTGRKAILSDVAAFRQGVYRLSLQYIANKP